MCNPGQLMEKSLTMLLLALSFVLLQTFAQWELAQTDPSIISGHERKQLPCCTTHHPAKLLSCYWDYVSSWQFKTNYSWAIN